jgi:protein MpaA
MSKKRSTILAILALMAILSIAGCHEPVDYPRIVAEPQSLIDTLPAQRLIAGESVENRLIECLILGHGRDVTFILATIHGNEPAGTELVRYLAQYLPQHPQLLAGRTVLLLPVANPDGMARNSRENARGVDLNRNFAAANRSDNKSSGAAPLSEPESLIIEQLIRQYAPDRIVSIHQPWTCIDYDGPAKALASRMAQYCNLPVKKHGALPGSLGSYAGVTLGIPIITFELLPGDTALSPVRLWQRYGRALIAAIVYPDPVK